MARRSIAGLFFVVCFGQHDFTSHIKCHSVRLDGVDARGCPELRYMEEIGVCA